MKSVSEGVDKKNLKPRLTKKNEYQTVTFKVLETVTMFVW